MFSSGGAPARFALVDVIGLPDALTSALQKSLDGTLAPIVPVPAVRSAVRVKASPSFG